MREIKKLWSLLRLAFRPLLLFELFYKLFAGAVLIAYATAVFYLSTRLEGYDYITAENIGRYLTHPLTLFFLLLLLFLLAVLILPDMSASIYAFARADGGKRPVFSHFLTVILRGLRRVVRRHDWRLLLFGLFQLPTLSCGVALAILSSTKLWGVLRNVIRQRPLLLLALLPLLFLAIWSLRRLYLPLFCFIRGEKYRTARRSDREMGLRRGREFVLLFLLQLFLAAAGLALLLLGLAAAKLLSSLVGGGFFLRWLSSTVISLLLLLVFGVLQAASLPLRYGLIYASFSLRRQDAALPPLFGPALLRTSGAEEQRRLRRIFLILGCLAAVFCLLFGYLLGDGRINPEVEHMHVTEVTAHRGASALCPENTMAAFERAVELGADWIELDVQQCADGELVILHDASLRRTTGVSAMVWELTWPEIASLDAGSRFSPAFAGERVPLLRHALELSKETGVRLNIELKPTGHERELESAVVRLVREYGLEESCVISSQDYASLQRVKAFDPELSTVYVMGLAYGNILSLDAADAFSIQAASITRILVKRLHTAGKEIYAWTVNSADAIDRMLSRGVDNVITDNVPLAIERVSESHYSSWVREYLAIFN